MNDSNDSGAKRLWQSQPSEIPLMSTVYLQFRATELERAFRLRNLLEQGSCVLGLLSCSISILFAPDGWLRAALALVMLGICWAMFQWRRRARLRPSVAAADTGLAFYLRELEYKRDLHKTLWRWYLLPMMPGSAALVLWSWVVDSKTRDTQAPWAVTVVIISWVVGAVIYERYKAAQYQRELDALAANDTKPSVRSKD